MTDFPLLTTREVAEKLRLQLRQVYDLIRSGELPAHKLGHRTVRVSEEDLSAYLARSRLVGGAELCK